MRTFTLALLAIVLALPALADESQIKLKPAPGVDKVEGNCAACHSLDNPGVSMPIAVCPSATSARQSRNMPCPAPMTTQIVSTSAAAPRLLFRCSARTARSSGIPPGSE